jgi:hypothetical protein
VFTQPSCIHQFEGAADAGEHAQAEAIDLEHAGGVDVVFIPFDDGAILHGRVFNGDELAEGRAGNDKPPDVLRKVAGKAEDVAGENTEPDDGGIGRIEAHFSQVIRVQPLGIPPIHIFGEAVDQVEREAKGLADITHCAAAAIGNDFGGEGGAIATVLGIDVLNDLFAAFVFKVDIDVGGFIALLADEAFKEKIDAGGIY